MYNLEPVQLDFLPIVRMVTSWGTVVTPCLFCLTSLAVLGCLLLGRGPVILPVFYLGTALKVDIFLFP